MSIDVRARRSGAPAPAPAPALTRALCALVALAAGLVGCVMLVLPRSTGRYFSWSLGPPSLAALVGAFYVASAVVFGWAAAREQWRGQRGLCIAVFGLSLPALVATARHRDVFDFGRWQAMAWAVLFVASPLLFGTALFRGRGAMPLRRPRLRPWARRVLATTSAVYGALAVVLWIAPAAVSRHGPLAAGPMGIRFAGAWAAFLALLGAYAAFRATWEDVRVPLVALVAWPVAALAAAISRLDDLEAGAPRAAYLGTLILLASVALCVLVTGRDASTWRRTARP